MGGFLAVHVPVIDWCLHRRGTSEGSAGPQLFSRGPCLLRAGRGVETLLQSSSLTGPLVGLTSQICVGEELSGQIPQGHQDEKLLIGQRGRPFRVCHCLKTSGCNRSVSLWRYPACTFLSVLHCLSLVLYFITSQHYYVVGVIISNDGTSCL